MKKEERNLRDNKGSITTIVTVTVIFFVTVLSAAFTIMANVRQAQIKSEMTVKEMYQNQLDQASEIVDTLKNREL